MCECVYTSHCKGQEGRKEFFFQSWIAVLLLLLYYWQFSHCPASTKTVSKVGGTIEKAVGEVVENFMSQWHSYREWCGMYCRCCNVPCKRHLPLRAIRTVLCSACALPLLPGSEGECGESYSVLWRLQWLSHHLSCSYATALSLDKKSWGPEYLPFHGLERGAFLCLENFVDIANVQLWMLNHLKS